MSSASSQTIDEVFSQIKIPIKLPPIPKLIPKNDKFDNSILLKHRRAKETECDLTEKMFVF